MSATPVDGKDVVQFVLCDRGNGLSEEVLSHLFEAFFTTKAEGMGIGLNLCRSIVESHQGGCMPRTSTIQKTRKK